MNYDKVNADGSNCDIIHIISYHNSDKSYTVNVYSSIFCENDNNKIDNKIYQITQSDIVNNFTISTPKRSHKLKLPPILLTGGMEVINGVKLTYPFVAI